MKSRSDPSDDIAARLQEIEKQFEREMLARGFDPEQAATVPLTPRLASLYREREELRRQVRTGRKQEKS